MNLVWCHEAGLGRGHAVRGRGEVNCPGPCWENYGSYRYATPIPSALGQRLRVAEDRFYRATKPQEVRMECM